MTLNFDRSRSLILYKSGHKCVIYILFREISLLFLGKNVKSFEKCPMLYNWVFRCHGNISYVTFIDASFCNVHSIGPINVCRNFEINRYNIDEFRKHENIVCFI